MSARRLALIITSIMAIQVPQSSFAQPRAGARSAPTAAPEAGAPTQSGASKPETNTHQAAPPLKCRQYVASARTTIPVPCPEPAPGAELERPAPQAEPPASPKPTPAKAAKSVQDCRRFLPSIGETIAVPCADGETTAPAGPVNAAEPAPSTGAPPATEPAKPASRGGDRPARPAVMAEVVDNDRCAAAFERARLGTVSSGDLAERRRGC